jgi:FAD/FMN-containing dehydrogenase
MEILLLRIARLTLTYFGLSVEGAEVSFTFQVFQLRILIVNTGTFGIVTSYTLKVYPVIPVTVATFSYSTSNTVNADAFWAGFRAYLNYFPANTDAGTYAYFTIFPTGPGGFVFGMTPFFAPDLTISQTQALLAPWLDDLATLGINITPQYSHFDNYHDAWDASFPLEPMGGSNQRAGARLFPKANWANETILNATYSAIRTTVEEAGGLIAFQIKAAPASGFPDNAVNPAWRQTLLHAIVSVSFADQSDAAIGAASKKMETDYVQRWRDVSPGAGAYFNEASPDERDWQQSFWGTKYPKLYQIKQKVDPKSVFYATTAVGSEDWYVTNQTIPFLTQQTGQLCRK